MSSTAVPLLRALTMRRRISLTAAKSSPKHGFCAMSSATSPLAIIRNEELILIRAEARWFTGNKQGALDDINFVRVNSGGLAPTTLTTASTDDQFVTELLYNRRYSLFFEFGHRWWDARRFNRLATLDKALPTHKIFPYVPYPADECLARNPAPANACTQVAGI